MTKEIPGVFYDDPKMSSEDLEQVQILDGSSCSEAWASFVSAVSGHFMQMRDDEWPSILVHEQDRWYCWANEWNEDSYTGFKSRLRRVGILGESELYVFWSKGIGVQTKWSVFCKTWPNFLYEDEGCILVLPDQPVAIVLSNGQAWIGKRGEVKT